MAKHRFYKGTAEKAKAVKGESEKAKLTKLN
jgi:hypothetical protein